MIFFEFFRFEKKKFICTKDVKFFGFLAVLALYLLFLYEPSHVAPIKDVIAALRGYMQNYTSRFFAAIDNFYDGQNGEYEL